MTIAIKGFIILIALEHLYILWMEMFGWTTKGKKVFRSLPPDSFESTKAMAANQGLYNGFLAAGLLWSLFINDSMHAMQTASFFLSCVAIAGIYGAFTIQRSIFFIQAMPALIAIVLLWLTHA